jgi:iron only hydrogenase large subunit-like protein
MQKEVNELLLDIKQKKKLVAMLAPSFVVNFDYPQIIGQLRELGFDKVVELTFGAKMINRDYHKILENSKNKKGLVISTVCPGIVETVNNVFPEQRKNMIRVDSPMVAMGKICKKYYPNHKRVFFSPCTFKIIEAKKTGTIDLVLGCNELKKILDEKRIKPKKNSKLMFDKFYNDYTKIYPTSGGLSKTAHLKGILKPEEMKVIDGVADVKKFLEKPNPKIKFLDCTFCIGSCIGGPLNNQSLTLAQRKKRIDNYVNVAKKEKMLPNTKGIVKEAKGIKFSY